MLNLIDSFINALIYRFHLLPESWQGVIFFTVLIAGIAISGAVETM